MDKIKSMLTLQQELNDNTNGKGWENGLTKNGKVIDWRRCIWLEAAELVESYPWKHWKNIDAEPDHDNIKIEAVDIWHFVMSEALRQFAVSGLGDIDALAKEITSTDPYKSFAEGNYAQSGDHYGQIEEIEKLVGMLFGDASVAEWTAQFYIVALQSGLDLNELYKLYVGKNILNRFRQDHGYKDGSYIKLWDGKEDNVVMQNILLHNDDVTPQDLYDQLRKIYQEIARPD